MNMMNPEAFTEEYEELQALLAPDYVVVEIVDGIHPYMVEEPTTLVQAQEQLESWEGRYPDRGYLVYTLDEYNEAIRLGL